MLSAGHASMLLYALLHLTGYDLPMEQLKRFRQLGSETPGHPERGDTPGVEITTGPLGQGFANAVGFALAEAMLAARYNRAGHEIVDHRTWFICSDGDLMEGISHEAASIAGFLGLEKLIGIWDDNHISLDGPTSLSFGEDVPARFAAYGWRVLRVEDGNDVDAIDAAMTEASVPDGRPTLIACRTHIGFGSPNKQDTSSAHGSPLGPDEVAATKRAYGWPEDAQFLVPDEVAGWAPELLERGRGAAGRMGARASTPTPRPSPPRPPSSRRVGEGRLPDGWESAAPSFPAGESIATRASAGKALNAFAAAVPELIQGAADLSSSTSTDLKEIGIVDPRRLLRAQPLLRGARARDGRDHQRHRRPRRPAAGLLDLLHLLGLHEEHDPPGGADAAAVDLRLHARLGRPRARTARPTSRSSTSRRCARSRTW